MILDFSKPLPLQVFWGIWKQDNSAGGAVFIVYLDLGNRSLQIIWAHVDFSCGFLTHLSVQLSQILIWSISMSQGYLQLIPTEDPNQNIHTLKCRLIIQRCISWLLVFPKKFSTFKTWTRRYISSSSKSSFFLLS